MNLVKIQFEKDISELRAHVNFLEKIVLEISKESENYLYSNSSARKKFDYTSIIISLYGIVESYTEKFVNEYLIKIEKHIFLYDFLEKKFREAHFYKSLLLMNKIIEGKHQKYSKIEKESVLNNLNNCITNVKPFILNKDAFFINTGNLKHGKICEIFNDVNINLDIELRKLTIYNLKSENIFNMLDDLVIRRNEIAHGAITEIADNSLYIL